MSMIGEFRVSDDEEIQAFLANLDGFEDALFPEDGAETKSDAPIQLDVDKAWHAIHFLLCGHPWEGEPPLDFIVSGGIPVSEDLGYGPARAFSSSELSEITAALEPITLEVLKSRFNPAVFKEHEIYPDIWDESESECLDEYVLKHFKRLKQFLQRANAEGKALIVYLT